jgi:valyl-tRNA synthetase
MIMMGLEFRGVEPFQDVNITTIIQAPDGRRMSKSLGTGIDPLDLINGGLRPPVFKQGGSFPAYGADAVRWGLLAMASDQDVRFSEERVEQGQRLTNKLWNASRLILLGVDEDARAAQRPATVEDRWILSRLERAKQEVHGRVERFEFHHAVLALYDFVYAELCDWYLELVKPRLRDSDPDLAATLLYLLTETLAAPIDEQAEAVLVRTIEAVQAIRGWRDESGVKAGLQISARLAADGYDDTAGHVERLGRLSFSSDGGDPVASVPVPGGAVEVLSTAGLDLGAAERKREAQIAQLDSEIERAERKLANESFVAKAPPEVVEAERDKLARLRAEREAL